MNGISIVLEGPDGSGTTSHSGRLVDLLKSQGRNAVLTSEPTSGPIGTFVRAQLREHTGIPASALQLLFCADRAMHMEKTVKPSLARGEILVSDRSFYSTIAYGEALGLETGWLEDVNAPFIKPDLLILTLPPLEAARDRLRERPTTDILEEDSLQVKVYRAYEALAKRHPEWIIVDTSFPMQDVAQRIADAVNAFLASKA